MHNLPSTFLPSLTSFFLSLTSFFFFLFHLRYCNFTLLAEDVEFQYNAKKNSASGLYVKVSKEAKVQTDLAVVATKAFIGTVQDKSKNAFSDTNSLAKSSVEAGALYCKVAASFAEDKYAEASAIAAPHVQAAKNKTATLYDAHLKEHVDSNVLPYVLPVYREHIEPLAALASEKASEALAALRPVLAKASLQATTNLEHSRLSAVAAVRAASAFLLANLPEGGTPEGLESVLTSAESDPDLVVTSFLYAVAAYIGYKWGRRALRLAGRVAMGPVRLLFWPFFWRRGKRKEEEDGSKGPA